jgi:threonine efflux protein
MFTLLTIAVAMAFALILPGPDTLVVTQTALTRGRRAGVLVAAGIAGGVLFYAGLALMGLGLMIQQAGWLALVLKLAGGAYLIWLAFQIWKGSAAPFNDTTAPGHAEPQRSAIREFGLGLITNLSNPKCVLFFASIFALLVGPDTTLTTKAAAWVLCGAETFLWFLFVATAFSLPRVRAGYARLKKRLDRITALLLGGFGLRLLWAAKSP